VQPTYVPLLVLDANRRTEAHLLNGTAKRGPHWCTVLFRTWYKASWTFLLRPVEMHDTWLVVHGRRQMDSGAALLKGRHAAFLTVSSEGMRIHRIG
jgi:hypothetical protein